MLIAQRTKETNISEHVIYMFQIEDLIRANNFDLETIANTIIAGQVQDDELFEQYRNWYAGLIRQMKLQNIEEKGHVEEVQEVLMELLMLHNTLLNIINDREYSSAYEAALPALKDFQVKSNSGNLNIVEVGFNALYGKLILKLKKQPISASSEEAFGLIAKMLGILALNYKKMRNGELNFTNN